MKNEIFDNLIKSRAEAMKIQAKPDWQKMSSLVDEWMEQEILFSDKIFDQMIAARLNQSHITYTEDQWSKFEKELDYRRKIKQRIIIFQLSGAAVFLLFAMLIYQLVPFNKTDTSSGAAFSHEREIPSEKNESEIELPKSTGPVLATGEIIMTRKETSEFSSFIIMPAATDISAVNAGSTEIMHVNYHSNGNSAYYSGLTISKLVSVSDLQSGLLAVHPEETQNHFDVSLTITFIADDPAINIPWIVQDQSVHNGLLTISEQNELVSQNLIGIESAASQKKIHEAIQNRDESDRLIKIIEKPKFTVSAYVSPGMQLIRSPFDEVFNEPGYSMFQMNTGAGVAVGGSFKKFSVNTGAEFSGIEYAPRVIEEKIEDGKTIHLKEVAIKTLKMPVHLGFELFRNKFWQIYCKAGLSFNIIMEAQYDMEEKYNGLAYLIENLRTNPDFVKSLYSKKEFEPGLLDQGKLASNLKSSVDFGVGIKTTISKNAYVYMEPMIHLDTSNKGYGPNRDRVHMMHLKTGIALNIH